MNQPAASLDGNMQHIREQRTLSFVAVATHEAVAPIPILLRTFLPSPFFAFILTIPVVQGQFTALGQSLDDGRAQCGVVSVVA